MIRVGVIDYGVGNLRSVSNAVSHLGAEPVVSSQAAELSQCDRLILPGVGAFAHGMQALRERGLDAEIVRWAGAGKPLLGICLGMQLLLESSSEFGHAPGLGIVPGHIDALDRLPQAAQALRLPHVSWAPVRPVSPAADPLLRGLSPEATFYFVHSYALSADNPHCLAESDYLGVRFAAVVGSGSVFGVQFHPEKSGPAGLQLLQNFLFAA